MKLSCGIVTFNPNKDDIKNIIKYALYFEEVYIYDNTIGNSEALNPLNDFSNVHIIGNHQNNGLSVACSTLCREAKIQNFDFIMLFDQDSRIEYQSLDKMKYYAKNIKYNEKNNHIAIYCPRIVIDRNKTNFKKDHNFVEWCITSGSMIDLSLYGEKFIFDQNYFIDRLDKDFCRQILDLGYSICRINSAVLYQQLGENIIVYGKKYSAHSSLRHYYIARNRLYYNKKFNVGICITILQTIKHVRLILMYEPSKREKISMIIKGVSDYRKGIRGKKTC